LANALDVILAVWQKRGMKLTEYLAQEKLKPAHFALRLGVPASTVMRWIKGERTPSLASMDNISKATKGEVTSKDFLPEPQRPFVARGAA
jgi:DNA-binding transcriptional regulator YdaS (Cro superfamily)